MLAGPPMGNSLFAGGGGRRGSEEAKRKKKRRWGFGKPRPAAAGAGEGEETRRGACYAGEGGGGVGDPEKHAIAVAAATAAVAEAAVAAAHAAAAVVRLTSSGRCAFGAGAEEAAAAVRIQAAFRGYLARRAHRALKGLVKLQALVRGHIERKNVAEKLRCMQVIVRVQARARAIRSQKLDSYQPSKGSLAQPGPPTPEKHEVPIRSGSARQHERLPSLKRNSSRSRKTSHLDMSRSQSSRNWLDQWMDERSWDYHEAAKIRVSDDDKTAKILEVDSGKPRHHAKRASRNLPQSSQSTVNSHSFSALPDSPSKDSTTVQFSNPSPSSVEMESLRPLQLPHEADDSAFLTADNSPQFYSASSKAGGTRRGPFTPAKSECSGSYLNGFSDYPSYMAYTESSKAKVRSHSAPKQRPDYEKSTSLKRMSIYGLGDGVSVTSGCSQKSTSLHAKFTNKAYPGSGRLDRLGMPVREVGGYSGTSRYRY